MGLFNKGKNRATDNSGSSSNNSNSYNNESSIGQRIAALRKNKSISQKELANSLQVTEVDVINWEKDAVAPSTAILPVIANYFNVTIDYLITGKIYSGNTFRMTDEELCAKMDDLSMLDSIGIDKALKDGSIWNHVLNYNSTKVAGALIDDNRNAAYSYFSRTKRISDFVYLCVISNRLQKLESIVDGRITWTDGIKSMFPKADAERMDARTFQIVIPKCILEDKVFEAIACDPNVSDATLEYLMSPKSNPVKGKGSTLCWVFGIPYIIDKCYELNQKGRLEKFLSFAKTSNDVSNQAWAECSKKMTVYSREHFSKSYFYFEYYNVPHGFTRILKHTYETAMARDDWAMVDRFNTINKALPANVFITNREGVYIAGREEIYQARVNNDSTITDSQRAVALCLHDGILNVDELLKLDDYEVIKNALNKYPITIAEKAYNLIQQGDWVAMFRFAVNLDNFGMINSAIVGNIDSYKAFANRLHGAYDYQKIKGAVGQRQVNGQIPPLRSTLDESIQAINDCKKDILDNLLLRFQLKSTTDNLSKDFFLKLLNDGDFEKLIIKLCVLLELIMKTKYKLEGDLQEMLEKFFATYAYDDERRQRMYRLRTMRNSIVHPNPGEHFNPSSVTVAELRKCIEYVCSLA